MKNYITQYKVAFYLSWGFLYLIYPAWISRHTFFESRGFSSLPIARSLVILVFLIYFYLAAFLMNRYFNAIVVDKPFIIKINDWYKHIRNNLWLIVLCLVSLVLHFHTFSFVTILGELPFLERSLWIYDVLNGFAYKLFGVPLQVVSWVLISLVLFIGLQKKMTDYLIERFSVYTSNNIVKFLVFIFMFVLFAIYSNYFPYYYYPDTMKLIRYPPLSIVLYLITFSAFGTSHIGPRILQFVFYVLSTVYLYRTIHLYKGKEIALLGAVIFMFSPIIFAYASQAAVESGAVFFIILVSFHFLRFMKDEEIRDLILATFFLGTGFLYKRGILIMFIVCFMYLLISIIKKRDWHSIIHLKILLLSLVPILPWMKIGPSVPPVWSHLTSFDGLLVVSQMIHSQISSFVFFLFLAAFIFILVARRDELSLFFGLLFCAYYFLFTIMRFGEWNHRYMIALYPAIAFFSAQFLFSITQRIKWKHAFKFVSLIMTVYLIFICLIPRSSSSLTTYKYKDFETQYLPIDKASDWIKNNTENNEKILVLLMIPYQFYLDRIYPEKNEINSKRFIFMEISSKAKEIVYPLQNLKNFCNEEKISYIVFSFGPKNNFPTAKPLIEQWEMRKYLKENMDSEFMRVAKFNIEDNNIFIYKPKN